MTEQLRCPRCRKLFDEDFGALSRVDNETMICSKCGTLEAFIQRKPLSTTVNTGKEKK